MNWAKTATEGRVITIHTSYWRKPIPTTSYDWQATYDNYDGAHDSPTRNQIGFGSTEIAAVLNLIQSYPLPGGWPHG